MRFHEFIDFRRNASRHIIMEGCQTKSMLNPLAVTPVRACHWEKCGLPIKRSRSTVKDRPAVNLNHHGHYQAEVPRIAGS